MKFLGIETSCDETAAAIVATGAKSQGPGKIHANVVHSQIEDHAAFGGVVPEIAARAHVEALDGIISSALNQAGVALKDLDGIAVTSGPGLAGGLIVGTMTARALAAVHDKPLYTINHLEGHALTARLTDGCAFPYLLLLVSGGHTQILLVRGVNNYERWATTIDDALGEAFDKTAKLLGLPYPGGPQVEKAALSGDPKYHRFPRPLSGRETLDMSFSGLKTAVRKAALEAKTLDSQMISHICAGFQAAVTDVLTDRLSRSFDRFEQMFETAPTLIAAGGVAANAQLRTALSSLCQKRDARWIAPPMELCTDNAAMIAWAGLERHRLNIDHKDEGIRPRWPLDQSAAAQPGARPFGAGRKGAKA